MTAPSPARQRRRPEDAEREIVGAAESLLREGSYADLTVANVMTRTGLGRSSFYVYFADLPALLRTLAARIEGEFLEVSEVWLTGPGDQAASRRSTAGIVAVYVRHGPVLKALADAAATQPEVEEIFRWGVVQHFIDAVAVRCEEQYAAGRFPHLLPRPVCHALVLMTERYLADTLGRSPAEDPEAVAAALNVVWSKVLYGQDALPSVPTT
ncbi:MAG TPA: TetR/AcrR family transcriptional regulator [Frankiaceae bacterium]|nr:TetR/AcrR family transcriptional regulator [Frankiaceae bacterium]